MQTFQPKDRYYQEYVWIDQMGGETDVTHIDPVKERLFVGDICENGTIKYISPYRKEHSIPGILVYSGRTFGRKGDKMLYKCVPNDRRLPCFLIAYAQKSATFNKAKQDRFVLFRVGEWTDKHPYGVLTNTLGEVSDLEVFYSYQLHCKNIHYPIQRFTKFTSCAVRRLAADQTPREVMNSEMQDRREMEIYSIDPEGAEDFDDAIGVVNTACGGTIVSVYIANVTAWFELLELWEQFTGRISTIYLPDGKRTMIPPVLSDNLCSLMEGNDRYAFAMDIDVSQKGEIDGVSFRRCLIKVTKNYVYEDRGLMTSSFYGKLFSVASGLNATGVKYMESIEDSHDVVAFFMIMMNHRVGKLLAGKNRGLFRSVVSSDSEVPEVPDDIKKFVTYWGRVSGTYSTASSQKGHSLIGGGLDAYAQTTSPIRRIVDLINISEAQVVLGLVEPSRQQVEFVRGWMNRIEFINTFMRSVRKAQNDCALLARCAELQGQQCTYKGFIVEVKKRDELWESMVHVPELQLTTGVMSNEEPELYQEGEYTMHSFTDEATLKRKVRLQKI